MTTVLVIAFAALLCCAVVVDVLFESAIRSDAYPPEAAEAPDEPLEVQRAKDFTGEETEALAARAVGPAIVAGQDLDDSLLIGEVLEAIAAYRRGEDVCAGAPKELV